MITKTQEAVYLFEMGKYKEAFKIAKAFRASLTPKERRSFQQGYEAMVHPDYFEKLKQDPETLVNTAKQIFTDKYL